MGQQRIISIPGSCAGQPRFRGTRTPVHVVLDFLAAGDSIEDVLREYPQLRHEDILAAIAYAARETLRLKVLALAAATSHHPSP
jgi:uncharacterized protein (DUF433 family)